MIGIERARRGRKIMKVSCYAAVVAAVCLACVFPVLPACATEAEPQALAGQGIVQSIWAVNDGERVEKYNDDGENPNKHGNSAWDGKTVRIFGGRNEVIAFQVIVETGPLGIRELSAGLPGLKLRGGGAEIRYTLPASDPTDYAGRPISIFTENYLLLSEKAHTTACWIISDGGEPDDPYGWKPVQLIPENAKQGRGGLPVRVEANANQGLWFEIYTARDLPAGFYDGEIRITADGVETALPLELQVYDFTLPDENSINAMIFYEDEFLRPDAWVHRTEGVEAAYHRFAHRQRVEFVMGYDDRDVVRDKEVIGRFDGSAFTTENGYEGPGAAIGNNIIPRSFYSPPPSYTSKGAIWEDADAWMGFIGDSFPDAITFLYMPDEPLEDEAAAYIRQLAETVKANPGIGGTLPLLVTSGYNALIDGVSKAFPEGLIDIWDMNMDLYRQADALAQRAEGDDCWVYNGMRPYGGAAVYDCPATDMRTNMWLCFKAGVRTYFYWHAVYWLNDERADVWTDPITYRGEDGATGAGDGVLVYPGEDMLHPEEDRGIAGPCSGISMANLRRGLQDHLYLTMARAAGLDDLVDELLDAIVPGVFGDIPSGKVSFPQDGNAYEAARRRLAEALAGG